MDGEIQVVFFSKPPNKIEVEDGFKRYKIFRETQVILERLRKIES
jgi:hypothetical protein